MSLPDQFAHALIRVQFDTQQLVDKAIAEIRAMSIRNRRSLGQRVRWAMVRGGR